MTQKKLKAFIVTHIESWDDGNAYLVFEKTRIQAAKEIADYLGVHITELSCRRADWADKYGSFENIPKGILINAGWSFECQRCKASINGDAVYFIYSKNRIFCEVCGTYQKE